MKAKLPLPVITINYFSSEKNYNYFKKIFYSYDMQFEGMDDEERIDKIDKIKGSIPIRINYFDEQGNKIECNFLTEYLKPTVDKLPSVIIKNLKKEWDTVYGTDARIDFIIKQRKMVLKAMEDLTIVKHLDTLEKKYIFDALTKILDRLEKQRQSLILHKAKKLHLDMKKGDVVQFFNILYEIGIIKGATIYEIMDFVEQNFTYSGNNAIKDANKTRLKYLTRHPVSKYDEKTLTDFLRMVLNY